MRAALISTYDLGHQPFGLASPAAWLRRDGHEVRPVDLAKESLPEDWIRGAHLVGFHLPMHTATRLASPVIRKVRLINPDARICAYGLYAPLNEGWLRALGVSDVLGGEFEADLAAIARACAARGEARPAPPASQTASASPSSRPLPRLKFLVPDRQGLPPLGRYATLGMADGRRRIAGYTEASRGCLHTCRHCPIVPVYDGS